jgi:hypothetical protein
MVGLVVFIDVWESATMLEWRFELLVEACYAGDKRFGSERGMKPDEAWDAGGMGCQTLVLKES